MGADTYRHPPRAARRCLRPAPGWLAAAVGAAVVLAGWDAPLVDDTLFWWVPKAMAVAERGPALVLAGPLPEAVRAGGPLPPQWAGGLPDYGHPPLWFWWLGLHLAPGLLPPWRAVHLAALLPAAALGAGLARLLAHLGGRRSAWAAPALLLLPPVVALLHRADTDLPLLALTTWTIALLAERRRRAAAGLAALACWVKEPAILLVAPAAATALAAVPAGRGWTRRAASTLLRDPAVLAPVAALAAWGAVHLLLAGRAFAVPERLPHGLAAWGRDAAWVAWIALGEQGRWVAPALAILAAIRQRRWRPAPGRAHAHRAALALAVTWLGFFTVVNFLGGLERVDRATHVRYLLPGVLAALAPLVARVPLAALPLGALSLFHLHGPAPSGPEASLQPLDVARALRRAVPTLRRLEGPFWAGSYAATQLTRPWAGVVRQPIEGLRIYAFGTDPGAISGHLLRADVGEPLGRLQERLLVPVARWGPPGRGVELLRVEGWRPGMRPGRPAAPPLGTPRLPEGG